MPQIIDNPVINGFLQGIQLKRQKEQQDKENQFRSEEGQRAEKQLAGYLAHLKAEEGHSQGQLDLQKQQAATERAMHELQARKMYGEMVGSGSYTPGQGPVGNIAPNQSFGTTQGTGSDGLPESQLQTNFNPQVTPGTPSKPIQIGDFTFNPDEYNGPAGIRAKQVADISALAPVQAQAAGMQAGAVANAQLPSHLAIATTTGEQARLTKKQEEDAAKVLQTQKDDANLKRVQATVEGRKAAAGIAASARIAAAKIGQPDGASITNNAMLHALGQGGTALGNSKSDNATKMVLSANGFVDFGSKEAQTLKDVHGVDPLWDKMEKLLDNLPTTHTGAGLDIIATHIPTSDTKQIAEGITGVSGNIARTMGGEKGMLSNKDVTRALGLLVRPGMTKEQAKTKLQEFKAITNAKVMDQILGGMSDKQKLWILQHYDFKPEHFNSTVDVGGKQVPKFKQDSDGEWLVLNPKKGGYESLDAGK